jgi:hypothetical protein
MAVMRVSSSPRAVLGRPRIEVKMNEQARLGLNQRQNLPHPALSWGRLARCRYHFK